MPVVKSVIIAVVGMAGSGKSVAADYLKSKGFPVLRFGDITDAGLRLQGQTLQEENERLYREKLRRDLGMAAYAIKIEPRLREKYRSGTVLIVLDGLYSWEEYLYLKPKFPQLKLLAVYTRPELRLKRLSKRSIRPLTAAETQARDQAEIENLHKAGPIALADYLVTNNASVDDLYSQLDAYLQGLSLKGL